MRRLYVLLFFILNFAISLKAQEMISVRPIPKDSLSDLWIVTIDMSGSMKEDGKYKRIPEKVDAIVMRNCESLDKAKFVLLSSGMMINELRSSSASFANKYGLKYNPMEFDLLLIRSLTDATTYNEAQKNIKTICNDISRFKYERSFASLARPISLYYLINRKHYDFSIYRNIYHIEITDDGETNDQWSLEYNFLSKHYPEHFKKVNKILPSIACSRFDFISKKSGNFDEIASSKRQPYVYLTKYFTYEDNHTDTILTANSLVEVCDFHDQHLTLHMKSCGDAIQFIYVDTCRLNGHAIAVNQYLYPKDSVIVVYGKAIVNNFQNKVSVEGAYQEEYHDKILGLRYRTVRLNNGEIAESFVSAETKSIELRSLYMFVSFLLAIIAFIIIWRNLAVLNVYVNGKCYSIKRKAMSKLKNDSFTILTVHCDEHGATNSHFYKGKGISMQDQHSFVFGSKATKKELGELKNNDILIKSCRGLNPVFPDVIYEHNKNGRAIVFEFSCENDGDEIQFSYANKLSHNLVIKIVKDSRVKPQAVENNDLLQLNYRMLASSISMIDFEEEQKRMDKPLNNVLVNFIHKETLGDDYDDYAILNIFDYNSRNTANRVFLRYSLVCFFDSNLMTVKKVTEELILVAQYVLQSERQKMGIVDININDKPEDDDVDVDVSPMLSYLYLLKKGKSRLVYSPFADGRPPLADGRLGLTNKTVKVFPKKTMTLLNLPFKYNHPEMKKDGPNKEVFDKTYRENEILTFLGNDKVRFLNVERDWASGVRSIWMNGITYRLWSIEMIMNDLYKQKGIRIRNKNK